MRRDASFTRSSIPECEQLTCSGSRDCASRTQERSYHEAGASEKARAPRDHIPCLCVHLKGAFCHYWRQLEIFNYGYLNDTRLHLENATALPISSSSDTSIITAPSPTTTMSEEGNGKSNGYGAETDRMEALSKFRTASSVNMSPELFEKLYLSPQNAVKGELRKTFGNPTPMYVTASPLIQRTRVD